MKHGRLYVKLMNAKEWRELRFAYLAAHPLCERCQAEGYVTAARCVHHRVEVESGTNEAECRALAYNWNNLEALCYKCHQAIHADRGYHTKDVRQQRQHQRLATWVERLKGVGH